MVTSRTKAFTLIEIALAIFLAGIVAVFAAYSVTQYLDRDNIENIKIELNNVHLAQTRFAAVFDRYTPHPPDLNRIPENLTLTTNLSTDPEQISISVGSDGTLALAAHTGKENGCVVLTTRPWGTGAATTTIVHNDTLCDARSFLPAGAYPLPNISVR